MPNNPFDVQLASFKPTYVGLPIDQYEKTANVLENKYYQNQETIDKLDHYFNNVDVRDVNKSIIDEQKNLVKEQLNKTIQPGELQFAGQIIHKIVKDVDANPLLNAAVQDRQVQIADQQDQQKRLDKKDITSDQIGYANLINYFTNTQKLELDPITNTIKNKYQPTTIPNYVNIEDKVEQIVSKLGVNFEGTTSALGLPPGYFATVKGKDPNTIRAAVKSWMESSDEYKSYQDFVTKGVTLQNFARIDPNTNETILETPTAKDFRAIGFDVDDNGILHTNIQVTKKGKTVKQDVPKQFLSKEDSQSQRLALWGQAFNAHENDKAINFSGLFGSREIDIHKNDNWFLKLNWDHEDKQNNMILTGNTPLTTLPDFNMRKSEEAIKANADYIQNQDDIIKNGGKLNDPLAYTRAKASIKNTQYTKEILSSQFGNSQEGNEWLNSAYIQFKKGNPKFANTTVKDFQGYLDGSIPIPETIKKDVQSKYYPGSYGGTNVEIGANADLNAYKKEYTNKLGTYANNTPISTQGNVIGIMNKKGELAPLHTALGTYVSSFPGAFSFTTMYTDNNKAMDLNDLKQRYGFNDNQVDYTLLPATTKDGKGMMYMKVSPKTNVKGAKDIKLFKGGNDFTAIVNIDNPEVAAQVQNEIDKQLIKTNDPTAINYVIGARINKELGAAFQDIDMDLTRGVPTTRQVEIPSSSGNSMFLFSPNPNYGVTGNKGLRYKMSLVDDPTKFIQGNSVEELQFKLYNFNHAGTK